MTEPPAVVVYNERKRQWHRPIVFALISKFVPVFGLMLAFPNYFGKLVHGKPEGYGTLRFHDLRSGCLHPELTTYVGNWKNGKYHGKGELKYVFSSHGSTYQGDFKDGKRHGYGTLSNLNGRFSGYWEDDVCVQEEAAK